MNTFGRLIISSTNQAKPTIRSIKSILLTPFCMVFPIPTGKISLKILDQICGGTLMFSSPNWSRSYKQWSSHAEYYTHLKTLLQRLHQPLHQLVLIDHHPLVVHLLVGAIHMGKEPTTPVNKLTLPTLLSSADTAATPVMQNVTTRQKLVSNT